jgi:hypothetical protein
MLLCIFDMPHTHSLHPKATGHVCVHDYIYIICMCTHTPVLHHWQQGLPVVQKCTKYRKIKSLENDPATTFNF